MKVKVIINDYTKIVQTFLDDLETHGYIRNVIDSHYTTEGVTTIERLDGVVASPWFVSGTTAISLIEVPDITIPQELFDF